MTKSEGGLMITREGWERICKMHHDRDRTLETLENVRKRLTNLSFGVTALRQFIDEDYILNGQYEITTQERAYEDIVYTEKELSRILTEIENAVGYWDVKE